MLSLILDIWINSLHVVWYIVWIRKKSTGPCTSSVYLTDISIVTACQSAGVGIRIE